MARNKMIITGIILAAGTSARMHPENKLLLKYKNHTIIEETLTRMTESVVDDIVIVTGHEKAKIESVLEKYLNNRVRCIHNPDYRLGRAESIKCAIRHIDDNADAALFMVADKPGVSTALINRAIDRYVADQPAILHIETPSGRGHPIIFSKSIFNDLLALEGDLVGNELISKYADSLVKLIDTAPQIDIDNEQDYRILLQTDSGRETE